MNEKSIRKIKNFMLGINIIASIFTSLVISNTTRLICDSEKSEWFIESVKQVPVSPDHFLVYTIFFCFIFSVDFVLRQFVFQDSGIGVYLTLVVDCIVGIGIIILNDCNYNGLILWLLANVIYYIEDKKKYPVIFVGILIYFFSTHDILGLYWPLYSIKNYIRFYPKGFQSVLFYIYYGLLTLNLISFIVYCVYVIQKQAGIIKEIRSLYSQLSIANTELKKYADIKEKMGETRERNRLAREIHDTVGHSLTGISVGVDACLAVIDTAPEKVKKQLEIISQVSKEGISEIRRSVSSLRPDCVNNLPLIQHLQNMIDNTVRTTGVDIHFDFCKDISLREDEENTIFRIVQESVTNAIQHGKAQKIIVSIVRIGNSIKICVRDNGSGCKQLQAGFGIMHMKERVQMLHGSINFSSKNGFNVAAIIPVQGNDDD